MYVKLRLYFFFSSRRRHTRLQGDWSSDLCSSDLGPRFRVGDQLLHRRNRHARRNNQQKLDARHLGNGGEVGERIEGRLAQVGVDGEDVVGGEQPCVTVGRALRHQLGADVLAAAWPVFHHHRLRPDALQPGGDRKSTRLNSSHLVISYAVFCLKNKTPMWTTHATVL